ncbi:MAG: hypothetical protein ACTSR2_05145 [Candidatus Hodarchaeales archaeon]
MWTNELLYLTMVITLGFGLTALLTSMFEMMRTGFILTVHVILQMLGFLSILVTWIMYVMGTTDFLTYGALATTIFAVLALLVWLGNMFRGLMLFRCMQGSSFHSHVFSHQMLFVILSLTLLTAL